MSWLLLPYSSIFDTPVMACNGNLGGGLVVLAFGDVDSGGVCKPVVLGFGGSSGPINADAADGGS